MTKEGLSALKRYSRTQWVQCKKEKKVYLSSYITGPCNFLLIVNQESQVLLSFCKSNILGSFASNSQFGKVVGVCSEKGKYTQRQGGGRAEGREEEKEEDKGKAILLTASSWKLHVISAYLSFTRINLLPPSNAQALRTVAKYIDLHSPLSLLCTIVNRKWQSPWFLYLRGQKQRSQRFHTLGKKGSKEACRLSASGMIQGSQWSKRLNKPQISRMVVGSWDVWICDFSRIDLKCSFVLVRNPCLDQGNINKVSKLTFCNVC